MRLTEGALQQISGDPLDGLRLDAGRDAPALAPDRPVTEMQQPLNSRTGSIDSGWFFAWIMARALSSMVSMENFLK